MAHQQENLFDTDVPAWELDAADDVCVARVVLPTGPQKPFDYLVPEEHREAIAAGRRVRVPFGRGNRLVTGYCVAIENDTRPGRRLKEVHDVVDRRTLLSPSMLRLTQWMAEYYLCPWGQVLETVVPAGVRGDAGTRLVTLLSIAPDSIAPDAGAPREGPTKAKSKLPVKQTAVMAYLRACREPCTTKQVTEAVGCTQAPITALRRRGLVVAEQRRMRVSEAEPDRSPTESHLEMNDDQQRALDTILESLRVRKHETILLHGVTGSGKTEVYIQAIQEVVECGRQAIVLVPEISLTPQAVSRFRARFGHVAVLHSHLTDSERHRHWEQIASGEVQVIVGARSAVFAPTVHLGLIVIDEEHESTFKQASGLRYHARDVALRRAADEQIPLVLGSATPSLEAYQKACEGTYRLVVMPKRVFDRPLPIVNTIDLRTEAHDRRSRGAISRQLHAAMEAALKEGGQVILFLNRRGFSTHIQCPGCGEAVSCPSCDISLTHHKRAQKAICHYCDYQQPVPDRCPQCGFTGIRFSGRGTQKLEEEIQARFPRYKSLRMDTDSMQGRGSHEAALARFRDGEVQILLGTQMIAKGLDFQNVTLVGVIHADTALHLPDFRAAERTFQLVTQVAGRTGRGEKGGRVLVQTFEPDHPAIQAAAKHDYAAFAASELPARKALRYPPFGAMVRMIVRGPIEETARTFCDTLAGRIRVSAVDQGIEIRVLGPAPAPFARLRGNYRFALQLQGSDSRDLGKVVRQATDSIGAPDGIQWIADVDPFDML